MAVRRVRVFGRRVYKGEAQEVGRRDGETQGDVSVGGGVIAAVDSWLTHSTSEAFAGVRMASMQPRW